MTLDNEQIIRQAYKIAEDKDLRQPADTNPATDAIASFAAPVR